MFLLSSKAELFKVLGHPSRLAILELLREGERCVCEIIAALELEQSNTSQHLAALKRAGILSARKEGNRVIYGVRRPEVYELLDNAAAIIKAQAAEKAKLLGEGVAAQQ